MSVTLARGARRMAAAGVIVRRLVALEDFGGMTALCTDKTGALTEGAVRLDTAIDPQGRPSERVFLHAYLNASIQTAYPNPLDSAIRAYGSPEVAAFAKAGEVPYDLGRKRLSGYVLLGLTVASTFFLLSYRSQRVPDPDAAPAPRRPQ